MAIENDRKYLLIYVSISFKNNISFLKKLKKEFGFEIPYIDLPCLSEDLKKILDSYIYLEESLYSKNIFSILYTKYKQVSFTDLGFVAGSEVYNLINNCVSEVLNSIKIGGYYKIIKHPLKNLIIKVVQIEGNFVIGEYKVLNEIRRIKVSIANICFFENVYLVEQDSQFRNYLDLGRKMNINKAIIIDGHNILFRSMYGYDKLYTAKDHIFVGGAFGVYFSILKLKELFPEYEIHLVFDGYDKIKFETNPEYKSNRLKLSDKFKEAFRNNMRWIKSFAYHLGFNVYHLKDSEGDDVIGSIARFLENKLNYDNVLIYSLDKDFYTLVTDKVNIYTPRVEFRGSAKRIDMGVALKEFGVNRVDKINWAKSLGGDKSDCIIPVNIFNFDSNIKHSRVKKQHYLPIINESNTFMEVKEKLRKIKKFKTFINSGRMDANYKLLTIKTDIFNNRIDLSEFTGVCNYGEAEKLLEEFAFFKELEMFERNYRILRGVW